MALAEYDRRLESHRQKLVFGQELLEIVKAGSTLQELENSAATVAKIGDKMTKVERAGQNMKQVVTEKRQELEREIKSEFTATVKRDQDPDTDVLKDEIESVNKEVAQKEKNCRKLEREKEHLNHDRKYHKVLKGIAPVHFDKTATESYVKGYIKKPNGELYVFEFDLEKEDKCSVADSLWDNL